MSVGICGLAFPAGEDPAGTDLSQLAELTPHMCSLEEE